MTTTFETTDLDVAAGVLTQGYGSLTLRSNDQHTSLSITQRELGAVRLDRIRYQMTFDSSVAPMGLFGVARVLEGRTTSYYADGDRVHTAGDVFLCAHPDEAFGSAVDVSLTVEIAAIGSALFAEVAESATGRIQLLDRDPTSTATAAQWWRTYDVVRDLSDQVDPAFDNTLYLGSLSRLLASTALLTFPSTAVTDPSAVDRHDAHPTSLRRAIAYIEANPDRDLSPAEIASAAGVTIRALQLTFRRHLDTTPLAFLRRVRLAAVRDDLVAADPANTTVAEVATRWGFYNLGRFAGQYRAEFGELPSSTLGR